MCVGHFVTPPPPDLVIYIVLCMHFVTLIQLMLTQVLINSCCLHKVFLAADSFHKINIHVSWLSVVVQQKLQ